MARAGTESVEHQRLKYLALAWARRRRLILGATEVRLPRSGYRADAAATTPRVLADNALTAVFECKVSRADFLRDSAPEARTAQTVKRLDRRLRELRDLIAGHRPDLRRGEELFPEFDAYDLRGVKHETHDRLTAELRQAQHKLHDGTKFGKLVRWSAASLLFLVVPRGLVSSGEVPEGWGVLEANGDELVVTVKPVLHATTTAERVALLERIAAAGNRGWQGRSYPQMPAKMALSVALGRMALSPRASSGW